MSSAEILRALIHKELKVKYKRSILGFLWSLITPVALAAVYLFVFVYVYKVAEPGFIYFLLSGLLPWQFFNLALIAATNSFVDNHPVVKKVHFPLGLIPTATVMANLINFLMGLALLIVVVSLTGRSVWQFIPLIVLAVTMETALCVGLALTLSVWNVYFRDIGQLISIVMVVLFFATPVVYRFAQVPQEFQPFLQLNPMTSIMELYRAALVYGRLPDWDLIGYGLLEIGFILGVGAWVIRRHAPNLPKEF